MAKSKQAKLRKQRNQDFFESLSFPTSSIPLMTPVEPTIEWVAVKAIAVAILIDLLRILRRFRHAIWNRRLRAVYLALVSILALVGFIGASLMAASTYALYASDLSSPAALMAKKQVGTTILDRNGTVLYEAYGAQHSKLAKIGTLPISLKDATLAAEDPNFYKESGFSWRAMARAAVVDITHMGKVQGGSTLTQQLIKNSILTDNKSFTRKFKEVVLATSLEQRYSKDQILEMYLNETYYGEGANGVEAASQTYFHKSATQLTLGESALIAGLPIGPSRLDPNVDLAAATDRRNFVLERMKTLGKITPAQAAAAKAEPITANSQNHEIKAPWFVFYVLDQLRASYGDTVVRQGGLTVKTTLDLTKQTAAEQIVTGQINTLASHNVTNGALVSLDPTTGDIIAMVGSANYSAPGWGAYNVITQGQRQPGSSFKPFAYVTAFEKGWTGATTVVDAPLSLPLGNGQNYTPENYDLKFHGTLTLRTALDNSLNIPAIKVVQYAGVDSTIATANKLGATVGTNASACGVALVLGCAEVTPLDMASGYATFATGGSHVSPKSLLLVNDRYGHDTTKKGSTTPTPVLDPRYAYMISSILSDNHARQPEFPFNSPLRLTVDPNNSNSTEIPAAAKTGTTNDFRDNWTVGYTPSVVTAVWVGNSNNSPMQNVDGITGAAPIWHNYMEMALAGMPIKPFVAPAGITVASVCTRDGGLANPWDVGVVEPMPTALLPTKHCGTEPPLPAPSPSPSPDPNPLSDTLKRLIQQAQDSATTSPTPFPGRQGRPIAP
jgi:1A family penicillin-binding protein